MKTIKIFVEGKGDKKFIEDYLKFLNVSDQENFQGVCQTGGWTKLSGATPQFEQNTDSGGVNLVIFDADINSKKRRKEIINKKQKLGIHFELFLFPDDKNSGDLETLLSNIINPEHKRIFCCFEKYENCLRENKDYNLPNRKAKIYAYLEALLEKKDKEKINEDKRDYWKSPHWKLEHDYLKPLKDFLFRFLKI